MRDERGHGLLLVCRVGLCDRGFDESAKFGEAGEATKSEEFAQHNAGKRQYNDCHQAEGDPADPILAFERKRDKPGKPQTQSN